MGETLRKWKTGPGKLGRLDPLIGRWRAEAESPKGRIECVRTFTRVLDGTHVLLEAEWRLPGGKRYCEHAVHALGDGGRIEFWSFTSDNKHSHGALTDAADVHAQAIAFEAIMPAGVARMVYWPGESRGFEWAVESKSRRGWSRFTHHLYMPA